MLMTDSRLEPQHAQAMSLGMASHCLYTVMSQPLVNIESTNSPMPSLASRGTLLTALGDTSKIPVVPTVSSAPVPRVCCSTASASSAPARPASFLHTVQREDRQQLRHVLLIASLSLILHGLCA
jgi:hypothetical protein